MSSNISFLLSLVFVISMFVYAGDLCNMQTTYAQVDAIAITAGKMITKVWTITPDVKRYVRGQGAYIIAANNTSYVPAEGDLYTFVVYKNYKTFSFDQSVKKISINRSVVLGYRG